MSARLGPGARPSWRWCGGRSPRARRRRDTTGSSRRLQVFHDLLVRLHVWSPPRGRWFVTNQLSRRDHTAGGWSPTVGDNDFWGDLVAAAGEISCPSAGKNLSATGEVLMSADSKSYKDAVVVFPIWAKI